MQRLRSADFITKYASATAVGECMALSPAQETASSSGIIASAVQGTRERNNHPSHPKVVACACSELGKAWPERPSPSRKHSLPWSACTVTAANWRYNVAFWLVQTFCDRPSSFLLRGTGYPSGGSHAYDAYTDLSEMQQR